MDAQFLTVISMDQEGDNYEGISLLRPCYGAWSRKQMDLKLLAIGIEKTAIPTPTAKIPAGRETSPQYDQMVEVLERLTTHQSNWVTYPEGWEIGSLTISFDADKVKSAIQFENEEMTFAFLANFLLLGAGGNGGAYSLSADLSDFFTKSILYIAETIADEFNAVGRELIDINFGPQEKYPKLTPVGIIDQIGAEFATLLKTLADGKFLTPDDNIEAQLRRRLKLPVMREEDLGRRDQRAERDLNPPPTGGQFKEPHQHRDQRIMLAEKDAQKKIGAAQDEVRDVLKKNLKFASETLVTKIIAAYKVLPESQKLDAINGLHAAESRDFHSEMKEALTQIALESTRTAAKEVPTSKTFSEGSFALAAPKVAKFEDLPKKIQKRILSQSRLLVQTTLADLEKVIFLQFGDSIISTDSLALVTQDLEEAGITFTNGASVSAAGGNAASRLVNEARTAYFFDEQVLEEIESFTFINGDPVSEICQELAGQTCSKADVEAQRLYPPLHHNCKSYLIPNLTGRKGNPKITGFSTKHEPGL